MIKAGSCFSGIEEARKDLGDDGVVLFNAGDGRLVAHGNSLEAQCNKDALWRYLHGAMYYNKAGEPFILTSGEKVSPLKQFIFNGARVSGGERVKVTEELRRKGIVDLFLFGGGLLIQVPNRYTPKKELPIIKITESDAVYFLGKEKVTFVNKSGPGWLFWCNEEGSADGLVW